MLLRMPSPATNFVGRVLIDGEWLTATSINRCDGHTGVMRYRQDEPVDIEIRHERGSVTLHGATWHPTLGDVDTLEFVSADSVL